jgi:hypothetical protein
VAAATLEDSPADSPPFVRTRTADGSPQAVSTLTSSCRPPGTFELDDLGIVDIATESTGLIGLLLAVLEAGEGFSMLATASTQRRHTRLGKEEV